MEPDGAARGSAGRCPRQPGTAGPRDFRGLGPALLAGCLALWALQVWRYAFLCDDAFISFRYARNLAEGQGLVFNPGFERVEGYSNPLWVLILAAGALLGAAPDQLANPLLIACGGALLVCVWHSSRELLPLGASTAWLLVPGAFLASSRSYAIWCSSGLETKLFELLVVGGVFSAVAELRPGTGKRRRLPRSGLCFAAAVWTRPEGLLFAGATLGMQALLAVARGDLELRRRLRAAAAVALAAGGQLLFRWLYYGELLPNPYYAKVGGRSWWSMGSTYLASFATETLAVLWLPLLVAGAVQLWRRGRGEVPLLCAAALLPHALYVAAIGGDHFEYRPLDLYLPLVAPLLACGAAALGGGGAAQAIATGAYAAAALLAGNLLPELAHRDFPPGYRTGFPGEKPRDDYRAALVDLRAHPWIATLPGARSAALRLNAQVAITTASYVGVRQEEHAAFQRSAELQAAWLRELVQTGLIPADAHVAMDSVGVIPYRSRLRTLDRLGLTDRGVAREGERIGGRSMGHELRAGEAYLRQRGVELDAADPVHLVLPAGHPGLLFFGQLARGLGEPYAFARLPGQRFLVVRLVADLPALAARFPQLRFEPAQGLVALVLADANCGGPIPRERQLGNPYDMAYLDQAETLRQLGQEQAAVAEERCALAANPENPAAQLRALLNAD